MPRDVLFGKVRKFASFFLIELFQIGYFRCTLTGMLDLQDSTILENLNLLQVSNSDAENPPNFRICYLKYHQINSMEIGFSAFSSYQDSIAISVQAAIAIHLPRQ